MVLEYGYKDIVGARLLHSRPDAEEVEDHTCWFWVGIVRHASFQEMSGTIVLLLVAGLRRPDHGAVPGEEIRRSSDAGVCGYVLEVGEWATAQFTDEHWDDHKFRIVPAPFYARCYSNDERYSPRDGTPSGEEWQNPSQKMSRFYSANIFCRQQNFVVLEDLVFRRYVAFL